MKPKKIVLGVTSSISLYKTAEIIRLFQKNKVDVQVIMSKNATKLISPQLFASLSRHPVLVDLFALPQEERIEHISLAKEISLFLVAPATANIIGKFAQGIADDFLSTFFLAVQVPVVIAPAMNEAMYFHPQVQRNIGWLKEKGVVFVEPTQGDLACGDQGWGKLAPPEQIINECLKIITQSESLIGLKVLVTAGPTREYLDPVRYLSNPSSGKMGYALAAEAGRRGAKVFLVSGPTSLQPPPGVNFIQVGSAREMAREVEKIFPEVDVVIAAAAVVDYEFSKQHPHKLKKNQETLQVELKPTIDILERLGKVKQDKILVGFAAESESLVENARRKIVKKNLDLLVANDIGRRDIGFESDYNQVILLYSNHKQEELPKRSKKEISRLIWDRIEKIIEQRKVNTSN